MGGLQAAHEELNARRCHATLFEHTMMPAVNPGPVPPRPTVDGLNEVYVKYFPTNWPARMFLCVQPWAGRFDVEMTCVAAV